MQATMVFGRIYTSKAVKGLMKVYSQVTGKRVLSLTCTKAKVMPGELQGPQTTVRLIK